MLIAQTILNQSTDSLNLEVKKTADIKSVFFTYVEQALNNYGIVMAAFVIGFLLGVSYQYFVSDRRYREQINLRIKEKDERINHLNIIILERLGKVQVTAEDKSLQKRIRKFFRVQINDYIKKQ